MAGVIKHSTTLSRLAEIRQVIKAPLEIRVRQHRGTTFDLVIAPQGAPIDVATELALYYISQLYYPPQEMVESDSLGAYGSVAYIGILLSFSDNPMGLLPAIVSAYEAADVKLVVRTVMSEDVSNAFCSASDSYIQLCDALQVKGIRAFFDSRQTTITVCSIIFMLLYKTLTPENAPEWIKSRYNTFGGTVGMANISASPWVTLTPNIQTCSSLTGFFGSYVKLRTCVFNILRAMSISQGGNVVAQGCKEVVQMLSGSGLTHLVLIDRYLLNMFHELMSIPVLYAEGQALREAMHILHSAPEAERFYLRILYDKHETSLLERRHFPMSIVAASAIARVVNRSMEHFVSTSKNNPFQVKLGEDIEGYVSARHHRVGMQAAMSTSMVSPSIRAFVMNLLNQEETTKKSVVPQFDSLVNIVGSAYEKDSDDPNHPVNLTFAKILGLEQQEREIKPVSSQE